MPVVVGGLLLLAGVAVARNVLFFFADDGPQAAQAVASVELAPPPAVVQARPVGPPEARMSAWLAHHAPRQRSAPRDPFHLARRHGAVASTSRGSRLQGVLTAKGRVTALVDGAVVAVGERVGDGRVAEIAPTRVRLTTPRGDRWLEFQPWRADAMADGGD